jgi:hypothetical protein
MSEYIDVTDIRKGTRYVAPETINPDGTASTRPGAGAVIAALIVGLGLVIFGLSAVLGSL